VGALIGAAGTGLLIAKCLRAPNAALVAWTVALFGLTVALGAQALGFEIGFGPIAFRAMEIGAQVLAPLALAFGLAELAGKSVVTRFAARLLLTAMGIVSLVIFASDPLSDATFSKAWPATGVYYQIVPNKLLEYLLGPATVIVALFAIGFAAARPGRDPAGLCAPRAHPVHPADASLDLDKSTAPPRGSLSILGSPMSHEHYFICPHCGNRSMGTDRNAGFRREARGCEKCGFAYLFELLDDYYPAPNAAFFACDADGRIVDCGRGSFELTGIKTEQAIGQHLAEALGLQFEDGTDHVGTALEWQVRVQGKPVQVRSHGEESAHAVADLFPAYDDDEGGLLIVLTPTNHH